MLEWTLHKSRDLHFQEMLQLFFLFRRSSFSQVKYFFSCFQAFFIHFPSVDWLELWHIKIQLFCYWMIDAMSTRAKMRLRFPAQVWFFLCPSHKSASLFIVKISQLKMYFAQKKYRCSSATTYYTGLLIP